MMIHTQTTKFALVVFILKQLSDYLHTFPTWVLLIKAANAETRATLCDGEEPVCERMQDRHR